MFNFFTDSSNRHGDSIIISGGDFNHIKNVLRMKSGEKILVSCDFSCNLCEIDSITDTQVVVKIIEENYIDTTLPISIHLFQGLPKSDKMEFIIQKSVELGVDEITPVEMENCVVKLDQKKRDSKQSRWQSIAESGAKQSKRNCIPTVSKIMDFKDLLSSVANYDLFLVPYECKDGMGTTKEALNSIKSGMKVGILIGPEGGFSLKEIDQLSKTDAKIISLGKRILRTETAAITAVGMCMLYAETELNND